MRDATTAPMAALLLAVLLLAPAPVSAEEAAPPDSAEGQPEPEPTEDTPADQEQPEVAPEQTEDAQEPSATDAQEQPAANQEPSEVTPEQAEDAQEPSATGEEQAEEIQAPLSEQRRPVDELRCEAMRCRCHRGADGDPCGSITCRCAQEVPETTVVAPRFRRDGEEESLELPASLQLPVATAGFTLVGHRLGFVFDVGFPFLEATLLVRAHDIITVGVGYRSFYTLTNAFFGSLKIRVANSRANTRALSITALGGYGRETRERQYNTEITGIDGGFAELRLAASFRFGRHALDFRLGTTLGWIREVIIDDWGYGSGWFDGEGGVAVTVFTDIGWTARITPKASFFLALGVSIYTNSHSYLEALPRSRLGFLVDI